MAFGVKWEYLYHLLEEEILLLVYHYFDYGPPDGWILRMKA